MSEIKEALWEKYRKVKDEIDKLSPGDEKYKMLLDSSDKIMSDILKLEQMESENKRERNRNIITCATTGVSIITGLIVVAASFEFDKTSTLTSTVGRPSVTNFVSRMLFRK